ncbi:MAG: helix-turn-helix domain-containing protein [Clostridia bacterium]|nr:helix-turn-helix domain-containing protein [Clostridia bacterium]
MITEIIKKLRISCNYTQKQVADMLGVDRSTYAYYESGRIKPDIDTIMKLSTIFNVHYTQILESETQEQFSDFKSYLNSKSRPVNLSNQEIELLTIFRMLPDKAKSEIMDSVSQKINKKTIKFEK